MFNNYLWVKIHSKKDKYDWTHLVSVSREKPLQEDDEYFVDINPIQLENIRVVHLPEGDNSEENLDEVYLIFHFYDNYSDVQLLFTDYQKAIDAFKEYLDNQKRNLADIRSKIGSEPACIVVERDENFTASTIYLKDEYYDKYSQTSSPDEIYYHLYYPDKGDRWVLQKIKIS